MLWPRAKIRYRFSKARSQREAEIPASSRVSLKSMTSWYEPRMWSACATRWEGCGRGTSSSATGTGYKTGVGTTGFIFILSNSQGMATDNTGGVAAHTSPMTLLKFDASRGPNGASWSQFSNTGCNEGSYSSGLGYWKSSSVSKWFTQSGTGLRMSSEFTSEKLTTNLSCDTLTWGKTWSYAHLSV